MYDVSDVVCFPAMTLSLFLETNSAFEACKRLGVFTAKLTSLEI